MGKNTIRLTESELITLVRRIISENDGVEDITNKLEKIDPELEEGWFGDKMKSKFGWVMDAAKKVADLFKNYMDNIPEEELEELKKKSENFVPTKVKDGVEGMDSEGGEEALNEAAYMLPSSRRLLREGLLLEGKMLDKAMRILNKLGIFAGIGITGAGFLSFASQAMGYTDSTFLTTVHQIVQGFGCGIYCGPLSLLVILIGIALAIRSAQMSYKRNPGPSERGRLGESRRRYERRKKELFYERKNPRRYRR
jgi:hypothetical protein